VDVTEGKLVDVTGIEPVTPCLQIQKAIRQRVTRSESK
jgi:hypothetical protein